MVDNKKKKKKYISPAGQLTGDPTQFKDPSKFKEVSPDLGKPTRYDIGGRKVSREEFETARDVKPGVPGAQQPKPDSRLDIALKAQAERTAEGRGIDPKEEALADVPIPRAQDITEETSNIFTDLLEDKASNIIGSSDKGRVPGISGLIESNIGQAFAGVAAIKNLKSDPKLQKQVLELTNYMIKNKLTPEEVTADPYTQSLLRLNLNENDIKVLNQGKADVGELATAIEGLPVASQITKFTGGALTPTSAFAKITDLDSLVTKITSKMDNWSEAISKNPPLADQYDDLIAEAEQELLDAQSRIKLMIIQSPILQNAPEEVENIQENLDKGLVKTTKLRSQVIQTKFGE